ncbi:hypothetical protein B484DRAFT_81076 [Ochromonadaceae sp. CCMP2298]|nr:hypothetical protein B484DRAFT_81076 [Ochromonadaceae sp. CCMP2298]
MDIPALPPHLRGWTGQDVPHAVQERLLFLWQAAIQALPTPEGSIGAVAPSSSSSSSSSSCSAYSSSEVVASHRLSRAFVQCAGQHKVELPAEVTAWMCSRCSVLLVPALTCRLRLRQRGRHSKVNARQGQEGGGVGGAGGVGNAGIVGPLRNQLVTHCGVCGHSWRAAGFPRKKRGPELTLQSMNPQARAGAGAGAGGKTGGLGKSQSLSQLNLSAGTGTALGLASNPFSRSSSPGAGLGQTQSQSQSNSASSTPTGKRFSFLGSKQGQGQGQGSKLGAGGRGLGPSFSAPSLMRRRDSAPARLHEGGGSGDSGGDGGGSEGGSGGGSGGAVGEDFISLSAFSPSRGSSSAQRGSGSGSVKRQWGTGSAPAPASAPASGSAGGRLNLLDLERLSKKQKKQQRRG